MKPRPAIVASSTSGTCNYTFQLLGGVIKTMTQSIGCVLPSGATATCRNHTINVYYDTETPTCTYSDNFNITTNGSVTLTIGCNDGSGSGNLVI